MFALFNNFFGKGRYRKSVEQALTMCVLDEIEEEDRAMQDRSRVLAENERMLAIMQAKEQAVNALTTHSKAICTISEELAEAAAVRDHLCMEDYIAPFQTYLLYDAVCHAGRVSSEKQQALDYVLQYIPEKLSMSAAQIFNHVHGGTDEGKLICAMKDFPLVILDLGHKSQKTEMGNRFLREIAELLMAAGDLLELEYPGAGYSQAARQTGQEWMDRLLERIQG